MIPETTAPADAGTRSLRPGLLVAAVLLCVYGGLALTVDFPRAALGIQSDEATYYMMGHSLAEDGDLTYRRDDLVRVWKEFPSGPTGVFLKKGTDVLEAGPMRRWPFVWTRTQDDPDRSRLFYGKSFIYPLFAAPFVKVFGTNGFLVLHALLLALVTWCGYLFLHARMPAVTAALLVSAFVMATVVPVYFVWITPELFNFSLGLLAYFCWLYKEVAPPSHAGPRGRWLLGARSDLLAALLLGIATFSKPWSAFLFPPLVLYLLWRRRLILSLAASAVFLIAALGLFGINMAISGEWNYQGGQRNTYYWEFPFQTAASGFGVGQEKARDEALTEVIFSKSVAWTNFVHNLEWFFVGRNAGLLAYFFPAVFALLAFAAGARRRPAWQYFVLGAALGQIVIFVVSVPYTWNGGGGSVGNRYFMGAYGAFLFLLPPITRASVAIVPWVIGALFTTPLVLNPFITSFKPGDHAKSGPFRWLPVELTLVYDWPINNEGERRVRIWFGDNPKGSSPGFQIYFFDDNAFVEGDGTFWAKGESRAEFLIKTDRPMKRLLLTFTAGPEAVRVKARLSGRSQAIALQPGESQQLAFALGDGFPYQGTWPVWTASVSTSSGFVPIFYGDSKDTRFLGVRVKPVLVE
jgi:hypothetical protein